MTFDVGGTLLECWPSVGHVYADVAARHGHPGISPHVLNEKFEIAWREFKNFSHSPADWAVLVDQTFHGLIDSVPSRSFFPQLFDRFAEPDAWHIFDDVLPTLDMLKSRDLKLGIISNWDERLRPLLRRLNLAPYFQTIIVSCERGVPKPARQLFDCACAALESEPAQTLHVGDSLKMDVQGARAAGLDARWLRRDYRRPSGRVIGSLHELDKL